MEGEPMGISGPPPPDAGPQRAKAGLQQRGDMGPVEYSELDDADRRLIAAREAFPDLDIYRVATGYLAVPGGIDVYVASDPDTLVAKLRAASDPGATAPDGSGAS